MSSRSRACSWGRPDTSSPEQLRGEPADVLADQYSFAVTAFVALSREKAGGAAGPIQRRRRADARLAAQRPAPGSPHRRTRAGARRLRASSQRRGHGRRAGAGDSPRRRTGGLAVARRSAPLIAGGAALCRCARAASPVRWAPSLFSTCGTASAARRCAARSRPQGAPTGRKPSGCSAGRLDAFQTGWLAMKQESCEATHVRGEQSEKVLALRNGCLEHKLAGAGALVTAFSRPDAAAVDRAAGAMPDSSTTAPTPRRCSARKRSCRRARRRAPAIARLESEFAVARSLTVAGHWKEARRAQRAAARRGEGARARADHRQGIARGGVHRLVAGAHGRRAPAGRGLPARSDPARGQRRRRSAGGEDGELSVQPPGLRPAPGAGGGSDVAARGGPGDPRRQPPAGSAGAPVRAGAHDVPAPQVCRGDGAVRTGDRAERQHRQRVGHLRRKRPRRARRDRHRAQENYPEAVRRMQAAVAALEGSSAAITLASSSRSRTGRWRSRRSTATPRWRRWPNARARQLAGDGGLAGHHHSLPRGPGAGRPRRLRARFAVLSRRARRFNTIHGEGRRSRPMCTRGSARAWPRRGSAARRCPARTGAVHPSRQGRHAPTSAEAAYELAKVLAAHGPRPAIARGRASSRRRRSGWEVDGIADKQRESEAWWSRTAPAFRRCCRRRDCRAWLSSNLRWKAGLGEVEEPHPTLSLDL